MQHMKGLTYESFGSLEKQEVPFCKRQTARKVLNLTNLSLWFATFVFKHCLDSLIRIHKSLQDTLIKILNHLDMTYKMINHGRLKSLLKILATKLINNNCPIQLAKTNSVTFLRYLINLHSCTIYNSESDDSIITYISLMIGF